MATAGRYSRILQSARYYNALDNYIQYVTNTEARNRNRRIGQGEPRPASQALYVDPFNVALATGQVVKASAAAPSWTTYGNRFSGRTAAAAPSNEDLIIRVADFYPARVVIRTGVRQTAQPRQSRVTGMAYGSYGGTSTSIPFGREDAQDTQTAAFTEIRTAILGQNPPAGMRVTLTPEKF